VPSPGRLISMPSWPGWMAVVNARYRRAGHPRLPGVQKGQSSAELDKNRQRPDQGATWSRPGNQVALGLEMSIDDLNDLVHVVDPPWTQAYSATAVRMVQRNTVCAEFSLTGLIRSKCS